MTRPDKLHKQWKEDKVVKLDNCSINGALHNQDKVDYRQATAQSHGQIEIKQSSHPDVK